MADKTNKQNLKTIETEISVILKDSMKSWIDLYLLLEQVREGKLYEPNFRSFTAFVRHTADINGVHESILWQRSKAGKVYRRYQQVKAREGEDTKAIEELKESKVSPETLELCQKLAKYDDELFANLIEKAVAGRVTRDSLRQAYTTMRGNKTEEVLEYFRKNRRGLEDDTDTRGTNNMSNNKKELTGQNKGYNECLNQLKDPLKTAEISLALDSRDWMRKFAKILGTDEIDEADLYNFARSGTGIYKTLSEFPVTSLTTRYDRKVDKAIFETITLAGHFLRTYQICTHQVEIKVSRSDLISDTKMQDYSQSFDYSWLCVPVELKEEALKVKPEKFGLLLYDFDKKTLRIDKTAQRQKDPLQIERTLRVGLNRLL